MIMKKDNLGYFLVIGFLVLIVIVAIAATFNTKTSGTSAQNTQYNPDSQEKPNFKIALTQFDFGKVSVSEEKTKDIEIENTGSKDLEISHFSTSCDCTFVKLKTANEESEEFSMHTNAHWTGRVGPGEKAIVQIIYRPSKMPVKGKVERAVFFKTNDPNYPQANISFTAEVY